jgi:hypothetical protein
VQKTKGVCKSDVAILACCRTWWLTSSCDQWWVMVFSWIYHDVTCRLCQEMTWSQSRDLIFRVKTHVHNHMEPERLLCCRQTPKWY